MVRWPAGWLPNRWYFPRLPTQGWADAAVQYRGGQSVAGVASVVRRGDSVCPVPPGSVCWPGGLWRRAFAPLSSVISIGSQDALCGARVGFGFSQLESCGPWRGTGDRLVTFDVVSIKLFSTFIGAMLPLSGRQGAPDGAAESVWKPVHLRGWLDSHLRVVNSSDMQFQTQRRNHLQYCCQLRIARTG